MRIETDSGPMLPRDDVAQETQRLLDGKTKPRGSLGRLERLACRIAAIRGEAAPHLGDKAVVVMAADHGVVAEGVSAYPQEVTRQMLLNFTAGGAAINVLARQAGARLVVADLGVCEALQGEAAIRNLRQGAGTANFRHGPAMSPQQAAGAIEAGQALAAELVHGGVGLIGIGEMGIGNTTASSALTAVLTGVPPERVTGPGTGLDADGVLHKQRVITEAIACNRPDASDAMDVLTKLGGFEIAGMAGLVLGAARLRVPVLIDGFISSTAALVATRMEPAAADCLIASHRSTEPGHSLVLEALGLEPLLQLDLRLGEGTGAALAMPLVDAALAVLHEMATFSAAGVSDAGA